jgi:hypothetical protein
MTGYLEDDEEAASVFPIVDDDETSTFNETAQDLPVSVTDKQSLAYQKVHPHTSHALIPIPVS